MSKETGGLAFSRPAVFTAAHMLASVEQDGMTLRDYFAAKAMQSFLNQRSYPFDEDIAVDAYQVADAMLLERAK